MVLIKIIIKILLLNIIKILYIIFLLLMAELNNMLYMNSSGFLDESIASSNYGTQRAGSGNDFYFLSKKNNLDNTVLQKKSKKSFEIDPNGLDQFEMEMQNMNSDKNLPELYVENIFDDSYKIPMNRVDDRYSISRIGHKFVYESNGVNKIETLEMRKFCFMQNDKIATYLVNLYIFSEFTNLNEIENDNRIKVIFIRRNIKNKIFIPETEKILKNLNISLDKKSEFNNFIDGINKFFEDPEYLQIKDKNKKFKIRTFGTVILLFLLLILMFYIIMKLIFNDSLKTINKLSLIFLSSCFSILLIYFLIRLFPRMKQLKLFSIYNILEHFLLNSNRIYDYIENWNKKFFGINKIRVSVPISMNYIMFNLNPYQQIEIKHLEIDKYKKKLYKSNDVVYKDKHLNKFLRKIKNNMVIDLNSYSI